MAGWLRHGICSTLAQWNKLLFKVYIPRSWRMFLETRVLPQNYSIFDFWPPKDVSWELKAVCSSLVGDVLEEVAKFESSIWPVYTFQDTADVQYKSLQAVISADEFAKKAVLDVMTKIGSRFTRPPRHIFQQILASPRKFSSLTPEEAHKNLIVGYLFVPLYFSALNIRRQGKVVDILDLSNLEQNILLEYLLSSKDIRNICDLPLVPMTNGNKVALSDASLETATVHTMLTRAEWDVFGPCDDQAIPLHHVPPPVSEILRLKGPEVVNVRPLEVPQIIQYLSEYPNRLQLELSITRTDPCAVQWLSSFWVWMNNYPQKRELFAKIGQLYLLPSTDGLRKADSPLFKFRGEHPMIAQPLLTLGVPFFNANLSEPAHLVLASYGLSKRITDIPSLLDAPEPLPTGPPTSLTPTVCSSILKYFARGIREPLEKNQILRLRHFPIFPVVAFLDDPKHSPPTVTMWSPIPDGLSVRSVSAKSTLIPNVEGLIFIALDEVAPSLMSYLEPSSSRPLLENDLISLAIDHFEGQPQSFQVLFLETMVRARGRIPPDFFGKISKHAFVPTGDGLLQKPSDILDPDSPLASLYPGFHEHLPRRASQSEVAIVKNLQALGLLQSKLSPGVINERIKAISSLDTSKDSLALASTLLSLIGKSDVDLSDSSLNWDHQWLPTNRGLRGPKECMDPTLFSPLLFDQVLATLDSIPFKLHPALVSALGWDRPLTTNILIQQLDKVLEKGGDARESIIEIIKELSIRECDAQDLEYLAAMTHGQCWIPTTTNTLSDFESAVFLPPISHSGFHQILNINKRAQEFLRRLGCTDRYVGFAIIFHPSYAVLNQTKEDRHRREA